MRGFFAFGIAPEFARQIAEFVERLPPNRLVQPLLPADYHVTIKFLSEFSSTRFIAILGELCELGGPPTGSLKAGQLALWPTVVVLECEADEALRAWHARVNLLLEQAGFLRERHPQFHPHITLARRKPGAKLDAIEAHLEFCRAEFCGTEIPLVAPALWRSQPEDTGRRHQPFLSPLFR
jgi:2'-5' RNA ligase